MMHTEFPYTPLSFLKKVELKEPNDHTLQLYIGGQLIATFSQTGVTIDNILKEVQDYERRN